MNDYIIDNEQGIYTISPDGKVYCESKYKIPLTSKGKKFSGEFRYIQKPKREMKTRINNRGYLSVCFNRTTYMVHKLVAEGFCANPENKQFVNHKDGNKLNNHYLNLEWCTIAENNAHARQTGLHIQAVGHKLNYRSETTKAKALSNLRDNTVLSPDQILFARQNVQYHVKGSEFTVSAMAKKFGVSVSTLSNAISGKTFKHLK